MEPLIQALDDESDWIRLGAVEILGRIGEPEAVQPLLRVLHEDWSFIARKAADSLLMIHPVESLETLIDMTENENQELRKLATEVLEAVAETVLPILKAYKEKGGFDVRLRIRQLLQGS